MWGFTPEESKPYIDHALRDFLFREAVIAFLVPEKSDRQKLEDKYCKACKKRFPGKDCSKCDKSTIKVIEFEKKK
jgi:hypothetical protein